MQYTDFLKRWHLCHCLSFLISLFCGQIEDVRQLFLVLDAALSIQNLKLWDDFVIFLGTFFCADSDIRR